MNIIQILNEVEEQDAEIYGRLDSRRKVMRNFVNVGKKLSLISLPWALALA